MLRILSKIQKKPQTLTLYADRNRQMGKSFLLGGAPSSWTVSKPNPCSAWKVSGQPFSETIKIQEYTFFTSISFIWPLQQCSERKKNYIK